MKEFDIHSIEYILRALSVDLAANVRDLVAVIEAHEPKIKGEDVFLPEDISMAVIKGKQVISRWEELILKMRNKVD